MSGRLPSSAARRDRSSPNADALKAVGCYGALMLNIVSLVIGVVALILVILMRLSWFLLVLL